MGAENYGDTLIFFESKVFTEDTTGKWMSPAECGALRRAKEIVFLLEVTAADTETGDLFDIKVQEGLRGSASIVANDRVRFTQVVGDDTLPKRFIARIKTAAVAGTAAPVTNLAASTVVDGPVSDLLRYIVDITDAVTTGNLTFTA